MSGGRNPFACRNHAAQIGEFTSIWQIGAVALLNMTAAWNEFLFALVLTSSQSVTLPVAISGFLGERGVFWGRMAAAAVGVMIVPVIISIVIHRTISKTMSVVVES